MKSVSVSNYFRQPEGIRVGQPVVDGKKMCTNCKEVKPLEDYYKAGHLHNGFSHCKKCCNERSEKRRLEKKDNNLFF